MITAYSGKLTLVPTPIGNLKDITLRALEVLKSCDLILAEDTRSSSVLLRHYEIIKPTKSYHQNNEHRTVPNLIDLLKEGSHLAMISDAGTPGISDPGFLLLREAIKEGIQVEVLPGPTALIPALVVSGLPCDRFYYEGFLPRKKGRKTRLEYLAQMDCCVVIYESPHRILKCLKELSQYFGEERQVCVVKEISKMYEKKFYGTVKEVLEIFENMVSIKGEYVVVVSKENNKL